MKGTEEMHGKNKERSFLITAVPQS